MRGAEFQELEAFVAVAERSSFVRAASALEIAASSLSHTIRTLEERLGVRLLNRTTRSVSLTEAGQHLLDQLRPALAGVGAALDGVNAFRDTPAGSLRLNVASLAAGTVVAPILRPFGAQYPEITLEIVVDDGDVDIVGGHFDAGVRPMNRIERDMIAIRISPPSRYLAVASPEYFAGHGTPLVPQDLEGHNNIRFRLTTGETQRWMFNEDGKQIEMPVSGSLVTNDPDLALRAALEGVGIAFARESFVTPHLASGRLVTALEDFAVTCDGYHLFYPSRRQMPTPLAAFVSFMRDQRRGTLLESVAA